MGASKGSVVGHWVKAVQPVRLVKGNNDLLLLTQTVGLQNYGAYHSDKCTTNCGKPTQTRYHVPRSWLKSPSNMLVLFEETGGNPFKISVKTVTAGILCGQISESHYPPLWKWFTPDYMNRTTLISSVAPEMHLQCENGDVISSIEFASYGTPSGSCQRLYTGKCHASKSLSIVSEACQGRNSCFIEVSNAAFGSDPCRGTLKTLAVMARCSPSQDKSYLGY